MAGDGTLSIANQKLIFSRGGAVQITAWDIDMAGGSGISTLNYPNGAMVNIHGSQSGECTTACCAVCLCVGCVILEAFCYTFMLSSC